MLKRRSYRLRTRALTTEATAERIIDAFADALATRRFDDIGLEEIALTAGVTRQTILRRFKSKAGLLHAVGREIGSRVNEIRNAASGDDCKDAVARLVADYEQTGALIINCLHQESGSSQLREVLDIGRAGHRRWIEAIFQSRLRELTPAVRELRFTQLALVTDVWMWHLLRRDQQRGVDETVHIIADLIDHLLEPVNNASKKRG